MSKLDPLKERAFWHWEYQSRNSDYRLWAAELPVLKEKLEANRTSLSLTEAQYEETQTKELDIFRLHAPTIFDSIKNDAERNPSDFLLPDALFEQRFKRPFRDPNSNMNTIKAFHQLLRGDDVSFKSDRLTDITALIGSYHDWVIRLDGFLPNNSVTFKNRKTLIMHGADGSEVVPFELLALELFQVAAAEEHFEIFDQWLKESEEHPSKHHSPIAQDITKTFDQFKKVKESNTKSYLKSSHAEIVSKITEGLKGINTASKTRTIALWFWDSVQDQSCEDFESGFQDVYEVFLSKASYAKNEEFAQFIENPSRAKEYFFRTDECIKSMSILNLGS